MTHHHYFKYQSLSCALMHTVMATEKTGSDVCRGCGKPPNLSTGGSPAALPFPEEELRPHRLGCLPQAVQRDLWPPELGPMPRPKARALAGAWDSAGTAPQLLLQPQTLITFDKPNLSSVLSARFPFIGIISKRRDDAWAKQAPSQ